MQKQVKKLLEKLNWLNFVVLFVAGYINAFGVTVFLAPVKLYDSGISGTSMLLAQITPDALTEAFETGATIMPATGGYSKAEKAVVYFIVNRFQIAKMRTIVHAIDPKAFMTITEVADVFTSA